MSDRNRCVLRSGVQVGPIQFAELPRWHGLKVPGMRWGGRLSTEGAACGSVGGLFQEAEGAGRTRRRWL